MKKDEIFNEQIKKLISQKEKLEDKIKEIRTMQLTEEQKALGNSLIGKCFLRVTKLGTTIYKTHKIIYRHDEYSMLCSYVIIEENKNFQFVAKPRFYSGLQFNFLATDCVEVTKEVFFAQLEAALKHMHTTLERD